MSRGQVVFNRLSQATPLIREVVHPHAIKAAESLRDYVVDKLNSGDFGIESDSYALAESMYIAATGRDDYTAALGNARRAFAQNPSRHRNQTTGKAVDHFNEIVAPREELPDRGDHVFICALVTALSYGGHWETHDRPWLQPATLEWVQAKATALFSELKGAI